MNRDNWSTSYDATYFDSCRVEHVTIDIKKFIGNKNILVNVYRIQAYDSIMCEYFCIGFIGFILKSKIILKYFQ